MSKSDWDDVIAAGARLQQLLPDAVLVGGTAAATHASHRVSLDDDHVLTDLRERFDEVLAHLEQSDGWVTVRVNRPVLILGSLDGVETGIRQLIRRRPLEVEVLETTAGPLQIPTLEEMFRIKAWLVLRRNATRDYLDVVALAERLGLPAAARVAVGLDAYYEDQQGPGGERVATQLVKQLAEPMPYDRADVDLHVYRQLAKRWHDWAAVATVCRALAQGVLDEIVEGG
jgi:hypothetical protein